jgi:hypothetical protein
MLGIVIPTAIANDVIEENAGRELHRMKMGVGRRVSALVTIPRL